MSLIAVPHATSEAAPIKITNQKTVAETTIEEMINVGMIGEVTIDAMTAEIVGTNVVDQEITVMAEVDKGPLIVVISITPLVVISNPIAKAILSAKALTDKVNRRT